MKLLEALKEATEQDLENISKRIADIEAEADGLKEIKRLLEIRFGLRQKPGAHLRGGGGQRKAAANDAQGSAASDGQPAITVTDTYRQAVKKYLMANGPQSQAAIHKQCGIPQGSMAAVLKHSWFRHTAKGVELTSAAY